MKKLRSSVHATFVNATTKNFDNAPTTCKNSLSIPKARWASKRIINLSGFQFSHWDELACGFEFI